MIFFFILVLFLFFNLYLKNKILVINEKRKVSLGRYFYAIIKRFGVIGLLL